MEFLIPGLILVALMVYASTKIKKTAAIAFEPERIETADFAIDKADGFLNVLNRDPSLELDMYSREFGVDDGAGFRAARIELRFYSQRTVKYAAEAISEVVKVSSDVSEVIDGRKYRVIDATTEENGVAFRESYKLAEKDGRVFELKAKILDSAAEDVIRKAEQMVSSFEVK